MEQLILLFLPLAVKYGPEVYSDIIAAFTKAGYTVAQVDAIFSQVKPYDQLGIDPNAPVKPETTTTTTTTVTAPVA